MENADGVVIFFWIRMIDKSAIVQSDCIPCVVYRDFISPLSVDLLRTRLSYLFFLLQQVTRRKRQQSVGLTLLLNAGQY